MSINNGGQAFPTHPALYSSEDQGMAQGMSLRDYFAGNVFAAAMTNASGLGEMSEDNLKNALGQVARLSYVAADAMLAARETGK